LLFTITADATYNNGGSLALREEVYSGVGFDDVAPGLQAEFKDQCGYPKSELTKNDFLRVEYSSAENPVAGKSWGASEAKSGGSLILVDPVFDVVWIGDVFGYQAYCASSFIDPGAATGTAMVARSADPDVPGGWARGEYGFEGAFDGDPDGVKFPKYKNCHIELGPGAATSTVAQTWPGHPLKDRYHPSCVFGSPLEIDYDDESDD
jgi:hypothetical protein